MTMLLLRAGMLVLLWSLSAYLAFGQEVCESKFKVRNRTFLQLSTVSNQWSKELANGFVWVDNIESRFFLGGYDPFEIYIVVGGTYPVFSGTSGRLEREDFLKLTDQKRYANNKRTGPLLVPAQWPGELSPLKFSAGNRQFLIRVTSVIAERFGNNDQVELKLCQEPVAAQTR